MKIFITGATGFIGRFLVERLAQKGHEMRCLVRGTSKAGGLEWPGVTRITGDVTDKESLRSGMQGCDSAINLANIYSFWEPDNRLYEEVNVQGTKNVMECALASGVSKVVHVSSVVVYGKPAEIPFAEATPAGPHRFSRYAQTKYEGDLIAWSLHEKMGLPLVMVYPGAVLGPGDAKATGKYIGDLVRGKVPAILFPDSRLTYVHVRDVAEIIVRALEKGGNVGERYFACHQDLSFGEVNALVGEIAGVSLPRLVMPGWLAAMNAAMLTAVSRLTRRPPLWGMSTDQVRTMRAGFVADGGKAARELGMVYTPIRTAIEEEIGA